MFWLTNKLCPGNLLLTRKRCTQMRCNCTKKLVKVCCAAKIFKIFVLHVLNHSRSVGPSRWIVWCGEGDIGNQTGDYEWALNCIIVLMGWLMLRNRSLQAFRRRPCLACCTWSSWCHQKRKQHSRPPRCLRANQQFAQKNAFQWLMSETARWSFVHARVRSFTPRGWTRFSGAGCRHFPPEWP